MSSYLIDKLILKKDDYTLPKEFSNDDYKSDCDCCSDCEEDCEDRIRNREEIEIKRNEFRANCLNDFYNRQTKQTELSQYELNVNCEKSFTLDNNGNFFKLNSPLSLKQKDLNENDYIERNNPLIVCNDAKNINLRNCINYLDDKFNAGWNTVICNNSENKLNVNTSGTKVLYNGIINNDIVIEKYTTKKIILIYNSKEDNYLWTVI
jgi:hypothetical protein